MAHPSGKVFISDTLKQRPCLSVKVFPGDSLEVRDVTKRAVSSISSAAGVRQSYKSAEAINLSQELAGRDYVEEGGSEVDVGCKDVLQTEVAEKEKATIGLLIGQRRDDIIFLTGCYACKGASSQQVLQGIREALLNLPGGLLPLGVFFKANTGARYKAIIKGSCTRLLSAELKDYFGPNSILVWPAEKGQDLSLYWYSLLNQDIGTAEFCVTEESLVDASIMARLQGQLPICFEYSEKRAVLKNNISSAIEDLKDQVQSDMTVFRVENSSILMHGQNSEVKAGPIDHNAHCSQILSHIQDEEDYQKKKKKHRQSQVINIFLLTQVTGDAAVRRNVSCAPIIHHEHGEFEVVVASLPLDVLTIIHRDQPISLLSSQLATAVCQQIVAMGTSLLVHTKGHSIFTPRPIHFWPQSMDHPITVIYPDTVSEDQLESTRRDLHQRWLLPDNRPLLRRNNAYHFPGEPYHDGLLRNTHQGLPPSGVKDGKVYCVSGTYSYHHYMQDRMDDNGWGCAYRSLQTLVSWYRQQGYTDKPIPTHKEIQQALVDVGDKEASFVGSKKWIGSTEVSYVLDQLLGVTCKILFVATGAELPSKGRELAHHFETQGTPIMIGGGVLAHTILGIDFSDQTGDIKFLILDPHYTGGEDLKVIQDKGWCGWKGPDFWDQQAYYNMCMPLRPTAI